MAIQAQADSVLYDAGFSDGVASVPPPPPLQPPQPPLPQSKQEQLDIAAAVAAAVKPLQDQIVAMALVKDQEDALLAHVESSVATLQALFAPPPVLPVPAQ